MCWSYVFFFKEKTAYEMRISDWSSDVCSSDLFFRDITPKKELLISLSAAKLLTDLTAAVVKGPTGPGDVDGLDRLIAESHRLSDAWCKQLVGPEKTIPLYLRSQMLKQAVSFLSREWERTGQIGRAHV